MLVLFAESILTVPGIFLYLQKLSPEVIYEFVCQVLGDLCVCVCVCGVGECGVIFLF